MIPIDALNGFLNSWKNSNWTTMLDYTQLTWRSKHTLELLKTWFGAKDLISFEVLKIVEISEVCVDITVKVKYFLRISTLKELTVTARVICETDPYEPSIHGRWGVNPGGILRNLNLEERRLK